MGIWIKSVGKSSEFRSFSLNLYLSAWVWSLTLSLFLHLMIFSHTKCKIQWRCFDRTSCFIVIRFIKDYLQNSLDVFVLYLFKANSCALIIDKSFENNADGLKLRILDDSIENCQSKSIKDDLFSFKFSLVHRKDSNSM